MEVTCFHGARKRLQGDRYGGPGAQPGLEHLRSQRRELEKVLRNARRDQQLISKRVIQDIEEQEWGGLEHGSEAVEHEKVLQMFKAIQQGTGDRTSALRCLQKALKNCEARKSFIRMENSMQVLLGLFTCNQSAVQIAAALCLYELSVSSDPSIASACSQAITYLLTYLRGQSSKFTELSLYTLGNLAADSKAVRKKMLLQGAIPSLMFCIQNTHAAVVQAAGYVVSQLLQAPEASEKIIPAFLDMGLDQHLLQLLQCYSDLGLETLTELAWCLHYLVCSDADRVHLHAHDIMMKCTSVLTELAAAVVSGMSVDGLEVSVCSVTLSCNFTSTVGTSLEITFPTGDPSFCSDVLHLNLVPALLQLLVYTGGVNVLVLTVLCNIAEQGHAYCLQLIKTETLPALSATLKMLEQEVVGQSMELLHLLFKHCPEATNEFKTHSGIQILEMIQYHSNEKFRLQSASILETHLGQYSHIDNQQ
ncbi:transmembrane and coiled-coil domain-containing protein 6 isoform X2 [Protopterus annectens]|uniref:transmembrane and coiled-coil domain-containing protein 6 isoform X2 n=1 Tax=Protopterus annectens TaxID=7888 RepID=UPI001CFB7BE2|nr:transmembrane and coiled-coil domain-containing protein 6 isoform X2 [Protopterus annectens]